MCGRFVLKTPPEYLAELFEAELAAELEAGLAPRYNIAPTATIVGLVADKDRRRRLDTYRWGLIPSWAKDPAIGNRAFNARAETVATKPSFRSAFKSRRVVVLADGYFEWQMKGPGTTRQPFYFRRPDSAPLAFAGLFETWNDRRLGAEEGRSLRTCTIITTPASDDLAHVHERMPAILGEHELEVWLDARNDDREELESLLAPRSPNSLSFFPVDRRVGDVRNDEAALLDATPIAVGRCDDSTDGRFL